MPQVVVDDVESPSHYCVHRFTHAAIIHDWKLDFYLGASLKYIERHRLKDNAVQDLRKAIKMIQMEIEILETGKLEETIKHA